MSTARERHRIPPGADWRVAAGCLLFALPTLAWAPPPLLRTMSPAGVPRGAEAVVQISGEHLADVREVLVTQPTGIGAVVADASPSGSDSLTLRITVAPDAPLAERELRVSGPQGVSNPLRLLIGQWPLVEESEPSGTPPQAQRIPTPCTYQGALLQPGEVDRFLIRARKGERVILEVDAARRGSMIRPVLEVKDPSGRRLPGEPRALGADPHITLDAPADGDYEISIRDAEQRGGEGFDYRIRIGPVPYLQSVVPLG